MIIETIESAGRPQGLTPSNSHTLAAEMRDVIIESVNTHGGHLGSNLGSGTHSLSTAFNSLTTSSCGIPGIRPTLTNSSLVVQKTSLIFVTEGPWLPPHAMNPSTTD